MIFQARRPVPVVAPLLAAKAQVHRRVLVVRNPARVSATHIPMRHPLSRPASELNKQDNGDQDRPVPPFSCPKVD